MNFNSLSFLVFLPIVVCIYWILPHKVRWIALLLASYYFYMSWNAKLALLILATTVTAYASGLAMQATGNIKLKKLYLAITITVCLGLLVFFKYANFLIGSVIDFMNLCGMNISGVALNIILPVGISFYTFQTLSYVIDVYRGKAQAERHFGYFALYVSFFPQLVAGPIERPQTLLPQLKSEHFLNGDDTREGLKWLLSGFIRKCVIADFCAMYVNKVYASLDTSNSLAIFTASFLFLIQMYNDFAGYSEIAMGSARLMGIKLSQNFNMPLISKSCTEFFRRWHITLNQWFTQYVYIPMGGNRKGTARKIFNTLVVFLLCGLWHGANWTYVLWGLVAGITISLETLLKKPCLKLLAKLKINPDSQWLSGARVVCMLCLFSLSCILFRAQSVAQIGTAFTRLFTTIGAGGAYWGTTAEQLGLDIGKAVFLLIIIAVMAVLPAISAENNKKSVMLGSEAVNAEAFIIVISGVFTVALCWLAIIGITDVSGFQYFQF